MKCAGGGGEKILYNITKCEKLRKVDLDANVILAVQNEKFFSINVRLIFLFIYSNVIQTANLKNFVYKLIRIQLFNQFRLNQPAVLLCIGLYSYLYNMYGIFAIISNKLNF